jgi:hypothetical protein
MFFGQHIRSEYFFIDDILYKCTIRFNTLIIYSGIKNFKITSCCL